MKNANLHRAKDARNDEFYTKYEDIEAELCHYHTQLNGKVYNCDLNASYNIASRYYIRKILKSCPETDRLDILTKVPRCSKRSTCTLADLISLNAVLAA